MYKDSLFFCLQPEWQFQYAENIGGKLFKNKIIEIPSDLGEGQSFFVQIIPGISALFLNFRLIKPIKIQSIQEETHRYIFHFDLSEKSNFVTIHNKNNEIGGSINHDLAILSNQTESFFEPSVKKKIFVLRVYVDNKMMKNFIENISNNEDLIQSLELASKDIFLDSIDSNSLLAMLSLQKRSITDESLDAYIKGIALELLTNFTKKHTVVQTDDNEESQNKGIAASKNYLMDCLYDNFPSLPLLSKIAGMSSTKFKILFKKKYKTTAKQMFLLEKMKLANKMLLSGDYFSMSEILNDLNSSRGESFALRYFQVFKRKPFQDFNKKEKN